MLQIDQIRLDFRAKSPLYLQLVDQMREQIAHGQLQADDQLPPVRSLASSLRVNFNTVARAYRVLDIEGWISTQQGRGTYVTPQSWPYSPDHQAEGSAPPAGKSEEEGLVDTLPEEAADILLESRRRTLVAEWVEQARQAGISIEKIAAYVLLTYPDMQPTDAGPAQPMEKESQQSHLRKRTSHRAIRSKPRTNAHSRKKAPVRDRSQEPAQVSDEWFLDQPSGVGTTNTRYRYQKKRRSTTKKRQRKHLGR